MDLARTGLAALVAFSAMSHSTTARAAEGTGSARTGTYQALTEAELAALDAASIASEGHLSSMAAGGDCQTVCRDVKDSYGEWKRVCDTSCADAPSDSGPRTSKHPHLSACLLGAAGGAVIGLLGGWAGSAIGAGVGCAVFGGLNFIMSD